MDLWKWLSNIKINEYDIATVLMNLSLAIVPFLLVYFLNFLWVKDNIFRKGQKFFYSFFAFFLWFIFVPNTAYIMTDMRHINNFCPKNYYNVCIENSWMILFFFSYSLVGWILFVYSLKQMHNLLQKIKNNFLSRYFILIIIPFIAFGVMIGLIDRYNTWNIFLSPVIFFKDGLKYFTNEVYFLNYIIVTFFLYILYFTGNYLFKDSKNLNFTTRKL
jgi:uncharacterized membrane protein